MGWFSNVPPVQDDANAFSFKQWFQQIYRMLRGETRAIKAVTAATNAGEDYLYPVDCTAGAVTITLPLAANFQYKKYCVKKIDATANAVTIARSGSDTIDGATSTSLAARWDTVIVASNGVATWYKINSTASGTSTTTIQNNEFTTPGDGTWNVPANVGAVWLTAIGGGAGGEGNPGNGSYTIGKEGGGSGELVANFLVPVTPGGTVTYHVGAGGAGGVATYGSDGVATRFGAYYALGGRAKSALNAYSYGGGAGGGTNNGLGTAESVHHFGGSAGGVGAASGTVAGGSGGPAGGYLTGAAGGTSISGEGGGGGGAASVYGVGGAGGNHSTNGTSATSTMYGSGGGGAGGVPSPGGVTKNGGAGAGGYILITWVG